MTQVNCSRIRIKPGSLDAVREWARTIWARRTEAVATLVDERVQCESVFLEHASDGDFLVYYMRGENLGASHDVAKSSRHAIDEYHQQFMREHTEHRTQLELLVDLGA